MRARRPPLFGLAAILVLAACSAEPTPSPRPACPTEAPTALSAQAVLEDATLATVTVSGAVTGEFAFELYGDQAPIATANFVALARCGFYDGIWFHRILAGFVIQAGDPGTKTHDAPWLGMGSGGAGYEFEIEPPAEGLDYVPYSVAMANNSRTNDSQFFVSLTDLSGGRLDPLYTIFGQVVTGTDVIDAIAAVPVANADGEPLELVTIESIAISGGSAPLPSGD